MFKPISLVLLIALLGGCKSNNQPQPKVQQPPNQQDSPLPQQPQGQQNQPQPAPNQAQLKLPDGIPAPLYNWQVASVSTSVSGEGLLVDQGSLRSLGNNQIAFWYSVQFGVPRDDPSSGYVNVGSVLTYAIANCSPNGFLTPKYSAAIDYSTGDPLGEVDQHTWGQSFPTASSEGVNYVWQWVCVNR